MIERPGFLTDEMLEYSDSVNDVDRDFDCEISKCLTVLRNAFPSETWCGYHSTLLLPDDPLSHFTFICEIRLDKVYGCRKMVSRKLLINVPRALIDTGNEMHEAVWAEVGKLGLYTRKNASV